MDQTLVSGIAASGQLHLGNYLGALRPWVRLQAEYRCYWFVADLHALTVPHDVQQLDLAESTRRMTALYLAVGLDPVEACIFRQSDVRAHTELNWLLACATPTGWLNRMTQFKAKSEAREDAEKISSGLYSYPVLQAADILLYRADHVPVGADQVQHIELTRDVARRWNSLFGETFVEPAALVPTAGARVMGLDDPTVKMSKTVAVERPGHAIGLLDPPDQIRRTIMRAQTDSGGEISFSGSGPGVVNLLMIYRALTGETERAVESAFAGVGYGVLKNAVVEVVIETLAHVQSAYRALLNERPLIDKVLADGAARAASVAEVTLRQARHSLGLDGPHLTDELAV